MTDRVQSFLVALERDIRIDDAEPIRQALVQIRGVVGVEPVLADSESQTSDLRMRTCAQVAENSVRARLIRRLGDLVSELMDESLASDPDYKSPSERLWGKQEKPRKER